MFSILIPVFDYDCRALVDELRQSCSIARVKYEILVGNDGSTSKEVLKSLEEIDALPYCKVISEPRNIGRAFVLNHLSQLATYPYLIIIDSDARLPKDDFIEKYLESAAGREVVCGGIVVRREDLKHNNSLRYRYELAASKVRALDYRRQHPHEKLSSFNLLIRRQVFDSIRFDKRCFQYGFEDIILGIDLMREGHDILHVDNPLIHTGIDSNESFIGKTKKSLHVLSGLDNYYHERIRISRVAIKLNDMHLLWAVRLWHRMFGRVEEWSLRKCPNLFLFNVFKLGYFSLLWRGNKK